MNRRVFLERAAAPAAGLVLRGASARRPNILLIMTDQQFAESASFRIGTKYLRTPNMDSLAASGVTFTRAYCPNPLCVPSRASMFTGRYPTETGVMDNDDLRKVRPDPQRHPLLGTVFERAGYETGYFGKWHLPYPEKARSSHGFATLDTKVNDPATAAHAAAFLQAKREAPFLAVASFLNPHNICEWARGQELPMGSVGAPPPPSECPPARPNLEPQKGEPDIVGLIRKSYQSAPMFPVGGFDEGKWRQYIWAYYRMIEKADAEIGKVLEALRQSGQEENTLVVFTADHGDCQGSHRWNQKTILYEEAARVPLVLCQKGVTRAGVSARLVQTGIDLMPTLTDWAGVPAPEGLPGLSLKDAALGRGGGESRKFVVVSNRMIQGAEVDGRVPKPEGRMLCGQRYKYTIYSEGRQPEALVDLENDPGEMRNLAGEARFRKALEEHRGMLAEWCRRTGDPFAVPR
jgi:arylsulfatase A-like enzyme